MTEETKYQWALRCHLHRLRRNKINGMPVFGKLFFYLGVFQFKIIAIKSHASHKRHRIVDRGRLSWWNPISWGFLFIAIICAIVSTVWGHGVRELFAEKSSFKDMVKELFSYN